MLASEFDEEHDDEEDESDDDDDDEDKDKDEADEDDADDDADEADDEEAKAAHWLEKIQAIKAKGDAHLEHCKETLHILGQRGELVHGGHLAHNLVVSPDAEPPRRVCKIRGASIGAHLFVGG